MQCTPVFARISKAVETGLYNVYVLEGGSRCFAPDTLVVTKGGKKPISEVKVGDMVKCISEDGTVMFKRVLNIFRHPTDKPMVEVRLKSGKVIRCSADHKFLYNGEYVPIIKILRQLNV